MQQLIRLAIQEMSKVRQRLDLLKDQPVVKPAALQAAAEEIDIICQHAIKEISKVKSSIVSELDSITGINEIPRQVVREIELELEATLERLWHIERYARNVKTVVMLDIKRLKGEPILDFEEVYRVELMNYIQKFEVRHEADLHNDSSGNAAPQAAVSTTSGVAQTD